MNEVKAKFMGWQEGFRNTKSFPLFNIEGNHPLNGSTVSERTLENLGITVPEYSKEAKQNESIQNNILKW